MHRTFTEMIVASSVLLAQIAMHLTAAAIPTAHASAAEILLAQNAMSVRSTSMVRTAKPTVSNPQATPLPAIVGRVVGMVCAMIRASASAMTTTAVSFAMFVAVDFMVRHASYIVPTKSLNA